MVEAIRLSVRLKLGAVDFTMSRDVPDQAHSGWVFTEVGYDGAEGEYQSLYQIALRQPRVIPFLALPPATDVSCEARQIRILREAVRVSSVENIFLRPLADGVPWGEQSICATCIGMCCDACTLHEKTQTDCFCNEV
jgi:hypothetical protein